jgi:hypothetical protein
MKTKFFVVFLFIVFTSASLSAGAVYYIDATGGNYSNSGLSPSSPLKTIDQVNRSSFLPGDSILFKSGQTHYSKIVFPSSGSAGMPITIGAYGGGTKPILNGSVIIRSWTGLSGGVYCASYLNNVAETCEDTIPLTKATSSACSDGNWYWASRIIYYKPTSGVPSDHVVGLISGGEVPCSCIDISNKSNITVDGLLFIDSIHGICSVDTSAASSNVIIQNCDFIYSGSAIYFQPGSHGACDAIQVKNNYFYRCQNAVRTYMTNGGKSEKSTNWVISDNEMSETGTIDGIHSWPTTVFNDIEPLGLQNFQDGTITGNYIHDGYSFGLILYGFVGGVCSGNTITRNRFYSIGAGEAFRTTGDGAYAIDNNTFAYNIVWECGKTYSDDRCYPIRVENGSAASATNLIANNVVYGGYRSVRLGGCPNGSVSYYTFKNNIFAGMTDATFYFYMWTTPSNIVIDYNCYDTDGKFYYGSDYRTLAYLAATTTYGHHDIVGDPKFVSTVTPESGLLLNSPCRGKGVDVGLAKDFDGNTVPSWPGKNPDIGAYEFQDGAPPSILSQPLSQTIQSGQTAALSVAAAGTGPITYQWYMGTSGFTSNPVSGATSNSYTTPALTQKTDYWTRVGNSIGNMGSTTATISVLLPKFTISGNIRTSAGQAVQGVSLTFSGIQGTVTSDATGFYSLDVTSGWSGTVTPTLTNFTFTPSSRSLTNVTAAQEGHDFTRLNNPVISGEVKTGTGTAVEGVTVTLSNSSGTATTDANGRYSITVSYGWSGTATPSKTKYTFSPSDRSYSNMTADQSADNYTATPPPTISGNVKIVTSQDVPGVTMTPSGGQASLTTDANGNYEAMLGWSGTVTPSLAGSRKGANSRP